MHPDLEKLLDLKAKDETLAAAEAAVAAVTDAEAALDERLQRNQKERDSLARLLGDVTAKRDELMRRIEALRVQQGKRQQRLDQVKNVREATAVTAELVARRIHDALRLRLPDAPLACVYVHEAPGCIAGYYP